MIVPISGDGDPHGGLTADEKFLLHVIIGGSASLDDQLERLDNLRARDVITGGEHRRIRRVLESGCAT